MQREVQQMEKLNLMETEINKDQENDAAEVCAIPEGKFVEQGFFGGKMDIGYTEKEIGQMVENFEAGRPHYSPFVNVGHSNDKVGDIESIYQVKEDGDKQKGLWVKFSLDKDGLKLKEEKKYNYVSAEVYDNYLDAEGKKHGKTFAGMALTNRPRHKKIQKNKFEELIDNIKNFLSIEVVDNQEEANEDMNKKEYEEKLETYKEEFEAEIKKKEEEIKKYEEKLFKMKVEAWKNEKFGEGYSPANISKFAEKLMNKGITFDVADEFIGMTDKVDTKQVTGTADFTEQNKKKKEDELDLEKYGAEIAKKMTKGAE